MVKIFPVSVLGGLIGIMGGLALKLLLPMETDRWTSY